MTLYRVRYCDGTIETATAEQVDLILRRPRPVFDIRPVSGR
jgi:hypothetical protein